MGASHELHDRGGREMKGDSGTNISAQAQSDVRTDVSMTVNGSPRTLTVEPRMTLLDALRDELGLTGPKKSCDRGSRRTGPWAGLFLLIRHGGSFTWATSTNSETSSPAHSHTRMRQAMASTCHS